VIRRARLIIYRLTRGATVTVPAECACRGGKEKKAKLSASTTTTNMRTANPTTNFVNDYAMKRQKQMDRAKQIREERQARQQQQQPSGGGAPHPATQEQSDYPSSEGFTAPRRSARPRELSGASDTTALTVLQVSEEDLRKATEAGIVTPDQARQLWAMLSNQAIRVAPSSSSHVQADPHGFTMLSHTSSLSSTVSSPGFQPFGHSVTLESLKESIAQFKANQRQQQQTGRSRGGYPEQQQQPADRKSQSSNNRHYNEPEDEEPEDEEPYSPPDPIRTRAPVGGAARSRGARKPQWNDDVDVPGEPESAPPPPTTASTRTSTKQKGPIVSKRPTKASTTAGARNRRPAAGGGGGGLDDVPVGRGQASAGLDDMPVGRAQPSFGGGGGGGLDDMPVGRGQPSAGLDDMPVGRGQQPNDVIQRESQQMSKEAMRGCRHCGRTFRVSVLQRHESTCKDVSKPRRRFDMKQQRLDGVEGIEEAKRNALYQPSAASPAPAKNAMPKWKIQHEQFQAAMKAASGGGSGGGGGFGGGGGPPPSQVPDDRVPCPHCGRKFAVETAARHIPHCAHTVNKPKGLARPTRR